jgi:hypothetical protein
VGLFGRREPLHERLAREGGLVEQPAAQPRSLWGEPGITGLTRPRQADAVVTVDAPEIEGDAARFVVLPDGTLLVEEGPDSSLEPLAAAVEQELLPPYRARAVRRSETMWAVEAKRIQVIELPGAPGGDTIEVTRTDADGTATSVDGQRIFGSIPALEELGAQQGRDFAVHAERLDGDLWEVRAAPL